MFKDKNVKIILGVLIIYFVIMLVLFLPNYLKNKRENLYILSGSAIKIKYENGKWSNITNSEDYNLKEFDIYEETNYKGKYKLLLTSRFSLYNSDGRSVDYSGQIFAYRGSLKLNVISISNDNELTETDQYLISQVLSSMNVEISYDYNLFQKVTLDVDNDGILETIYCFNNYFIEGEPSSFFSVVFLAKNNEITVLEKQIADYDKVLESPYFQMHKVLDIREDQKFELLFTKNYFGQPEEECALLYNLYGKKDLINDFCK